MIVFIEKIPIKVGIKKCQTPLLGGARKVLRYSEATRVDIVAPIITSNCLLLRLRSHIDP